MSRNPTGSSCGMNAIHFKYNLNKNIFCIIIKNIGAINFPISFGTNDYEHGENIKPTGLPAVVFSEVLKVLEINSLEAHRLVL